MYNDLAFKKGGKEHFGCVIRLKGRRQYHTIWWRFKIGRSPNCQKIRGFQIRRCTIGGGVEPVRNVCWFTTAIAAQMSGHSRTGLPGVVEAMSLSEVKF